MPSNHRFFSSGKAPLSSRREGKDKASSFVVPTDTDDATLRDIESKRIVPKVPNGCSLRIFTNVL